MTEEQINEKALEVYPEKYAQMPFCMNATDINEDHREGYKKALNDIESLPKIKGCVARDEDGQLCIFYGDKPHRGGCNRWWHPEHCPEGDWMSIDDKMFSELTWEDEPIEIEILIRKL